MNRATRNISMVAAKLIATIAAIVAAVTIAVFVGHITDTFMDFVIGKIGDVPASRILFKPIFSNGPRVDAVCALLIPISIVLWWRWPSPVTKRIVACCLGIATAFVPVVAQVISGSGIHHYIPAHAPA